jgi:hypothetical protein
MTYQPISPRGQPDFVLTRPATNQSIPRVLTQPTTVARERAMDTWERLKPGMLGPVKVKPPGRSLTEQKDDPLPPLTWARPEVQAHLEGGGSLKSLIRKLAESEQRLEEQVAEPRPLLSEYARMTKAERVQRILGENHCGNDE